MKVVNVIIAGLGGQGVIRSADVLCDLFFRQNHQLKRTEIHGMAQRGGTVVCHIRISDQSIFSPMIPEEKADYILALDDAEAKRQSNWLGETGEILKLSREQLAKVCNPKAVNVATLALLIKKLEALTWSDVCLLDLKKYIEQKFPQKLVVDNLQAISVIQ